MIYAAELVDVRVSPENAFLIKLVCDAKSAGFCVPPRAAERYSKLMADINRVAEWKWRHRDD